MSYLSSDIVPLVLKIILFCFSGTSFSKLSESTFVSSPKLYLGLNVTEKQRRFFSIAHACVQAGSLKNVTVTRGGITCVQLSIS